MITFDEIDDDRVIFSAIERWIETLANGHYSEAFRMVYTQPEGHWSAELLKAVLENYGVEERRADGRTFSVTKTTSAKVSDLEPRWEIDRYDEEQDGEVAEVIADLPLNGFWSDLTALFGLKKLPDGKYTLELVRVDVL